MKPFENKVWLSSPTMHGEELKYVTEAYETNWMSTVGKNINEVERLICEKVGCRYSVALSAGTAALHPVEVIENICIGTMNVLRYARNVQVKGMVNLSSMEAFGQTEVSEHRLSECELGYIDLMNVRNCYPESKRLCECLCKSYAQEYGVNVKTARLAQIFGAGVFPNENRVFAQFARSVVHGENIVLHTNGKITKKNTIYLFCRYYNICIIGLFVELD